MTDHFARPDAPASFPREPLYGAAADQARDQLARLVVPLDIARDVARKMLAAYGHTQGGDNPIAIAAAYGALKASLEQVLDALDAEDAEEAGR